MANTLGPGVGTGTTFSGPLISGTQKAFDGTNPQNTGLALLSQSVDLVQNGATAVSGTITLPSGSQIVDIIADTTTAWNSGTSDTLSVGTVAAGTQYAGSISVATAGRTRPTFTGAQLAAMANIGSNTSVVATVTPAGTAATAGETLVTVLYVQQPASKLGE